ncbi:MAG: hypothetical protein JW768_02200 [Chitinispirillaceae bacterium]|nr:hypothetical protein [Chitinispirillaceae bacterium]
MRKWRVLTGMCLIVLVAFMSARDAVCAPPAPGEEDAPVAPIKDTVKQKGYRIDQPGTITFTVGMVIKGKVEKPQVLIFLPKEKTQFRQLEISHSFKEELSEPLPFSPLVE